MSDHIACAAPACIRVDGDCAAWRKQTGCHLGCPCPANVQRLRERSA